MRKRLDRGFWCDGPPWQRRMIRSSMHGPLAAVAFAGVLFKVLTSEPFGPPWQP